MSAAVADDSRIEKELDELEAVLARKRVGGEAEKAHVRHAWKEAERRLKAYRERGEGGIRAGRLYALAAMKCENWNEAIARWQSVLDEADEPMPRARMRLAAAYRMAGQLGAARAELRSAREEGLRKKEFRKAQRRLHKRRSRLERLELGEQVVAAVQRGEVKHVLRGLVEWINEGLPDDQELKKSTRKALRPLCETLVQLSERAASSPSSPDRKRRILRRLRRSLWPRRRIIRGSREMWVHEDDPPLVLVCGFGWSGSGAVTDFLSDFEQVEMSLGRTEMHWFSSGYGYDAGEVLDQLEVAPHRFHEWALAFLLVHGLGLESLAREGEGQDQSRMRRMRKLSDRAALWLFSEDDPRLVEYAEYLRELGQALCRVEPSEGDNNLEVEAAFRHFFSGLVRMATPPGKTCLLNNCIKGHQLDRLRLILPDHVIAVTRDPRDMYVSRGLESARGTFPPVEFVDALRERFRRFRRALRDPVIASRVTTVGFEDFVLDASTRERLADELGLTGTPRRRQTRFQPERSRQNIGIHHRWQDRDAIRRIAGGFRRRRVPAAD